MTSEYERMKALLEGLGLSFKENGITNAEIYAYAMGIETVKNRLKMPTILFLSTQRAIIICKAILICLILTPKDTATSL